MKATPEEYALHQRLLMRDQLAAAALADLLYDSLVRAVRDRVDNATDPDLIEDTVVEALMSYVDEPEHFDPTRGTLQGYLTMVAHSDLKNALRKEYRRTLLHVSLSDPALQERDIVDHRHEVEAATHDDDVERMWTWIDDLFSNPIDRKIAELIVNQVRSPEPYIEAMGLGDQPRSEQLKQVRRAKDRISRQMRRKGGSLYGEI